jgi:thiol-disulfide isomerase/thioredoxin
MLLGERPYDDILYFFPEWREAQDTAVVDPAVVQKLAAIEEPLEVLLFLGTWCSDSRNGVPPFMKTLAEAENPNVRIRIFGVDREKRDPNGLAEAYRIERVPTFMILRGGQELGRMVETPAVTFAEDLLRLLDEGATMEGASSCDAASVSG